MFEFLTRHKNVRKETFGQQNPHENNSLDQVPAAISKLALKIQKVIHISQFVLLIRRPH
jgi:hypothetical protein